MIALIREDDDMVRLEVTGKVTQEDYEHVIPQLDEVIGEKGRIRALVHVHELEGAEPKALLTDLKWDWQNRDKVDRLAVVSDSTLVDWSTRLVGLLYSGEAKTFAPDEQEAARYWLKAA